MAEFDKLLCFCCGKEKKIGDFYVSHNEIHQATKRMPVCKVCLTNLAEKNNKDENYDMERVKKILREINKPFLQTLWSAAIQEHEESKISKNIFRLYLKNTIMPVHIHLTSADSDSEKKDESLSNNNDEYEYELLDKGEVSKSQDKKDVIRILGYDPFEYESGEGTERLYSRLLDFLDESTLEDGLKLQSSIEIVKGFNQIDKINNAITRLTNDSVGLSENYARIKSLTGTRKDMLSSVLALAKDNGISVNYNNNKSKGGGTLSGIIKQLNEKGLKAAEVNVYDIETYEGMKKVADISNRSIMEQLILNENDYTEMIKDQRDMITKFDKQVIELEEENRLLKLKLKDYENSKENDER